MSPFVVEGDDPLAADVQDLLEAHLDFARRHSPPEDVHALDVNGLVAPNVSFFSIREKGELVGIGALKQLDESQAEIKSMHTARAALRRGVGRAMVDHLVAVARDRGCRWVRLETGTMAAFDPARALYQSAGFQISEPFAEYRVSPNSVCMVLDLGQPVGEGEPLA